MTTTSGSTTFFRGMPDVTTERHELVLSFPLSPGKTVYKGQVLLYDDSTNQATTPTAGTNESGSTNGVVRPFTTGDAYTGTVIGVCLQNVDDSDTTAIGYGVRNVPILLKGITLMRAIVNDTNGSAGYDIAIAAGDLCAIGGGAGGGTITGSNTISGWTALTPAAYVMHPTGATEGSTNTVIGWFLDFQNGSTSSETVSDGTVTLAASQAETPNTWLRVYVDMFALHAGGTMAKLSV